MLSIRTKSNRPHLRKINLESFWRILVIISLVGIFALRIYAIYNSVIIRTWDDAQYRRLALLDANPNLALTKAFSDLIFPNGNLLDNSRSIGYHSWIVLALKLSLSGDPEQTFQLANLVLFIIQAAVIFCFGYWATKNKLFSGTLTFLYLSSPIVFGMNRWVMTENFVLTGLLIFGFLPCWLLTVDFRPSIRKELLVGIVVAWIMGIFASLREYAVPSYLIPSFATGIALVWVRRWDAFCTFSIVTGVFTLTMLESWTQLFKLAAFRVTQAEYFHPLTEWFPHVIVYVMGIALSLLLLAGSILVIKVGFTKFHTFGDGKKIDISLLKEKIDPLIFIWIAQLFLVVLYIVIIIRSDSRQARAGIVFMFPILISLLVGCRILKISPRFFKKSLIQVFCVALIVCSWSTSYYQLFLAFDGGKSFVFPPFDLEWWNYPLNLRPLTTPEDMHTKNFNPDPQIASQHLDAR